MQVIYHFFSPLIPGNLDGFSADGDGVDDEWPDGSTVESDDVWIEGNFPVSWTFRTLDPAILLGPFTVNLAHGGTDRMDDGLTDRWMDFQVEL